MSLNDNHMAKKKRTTVKKEYKGYKNAKANKLFVLDSIKSLEHRASLKLLFPILKHKLTQEEVVMALNQLEHSNTIAIQSNGAIELLNGEAENVVKIKSTKSRLPNALYGSVDLTKNGAAYVSIEGFVKDVYIPQKFVRNAMQGDWVQVRVTTAGRRPEGEIVDIVKRAQDSFTGKVEVTEKFAFFVADQRKLNSDVFIPLDMLNGAKHNDKVIVRVTDWKTGSKNPVGEVLEVLKNDFSSDLDMKKILIENGFSVEFPKEVYRELDLISSNVSKAEISTRVDLRDVLTFTIDPEDAKDFDDALSYRVLPNGNIEVGVHIADVSHYIKEGSALDIEAERRATSVYLPDRVCPMLPEKISNLLCSLRPNEDKLTFSTLFEFNSNHDVVHFSIAKTIIHSDRRFTYEDAQKVIETGEGDCAAEIKVMHEISKKIRKKRFDNGAIAFEKAEIRFKLDENSKPIGIVLKERKDANLFIEDFMLLANETVAKYGSKLKIGKSPVPFVYRIHDKPDPGKLEQFAVTAARYGYVIKFEEGRQIAETFNTLLKKVEGKPEQNVLETMAIRCMAKAIYTTGNIGHYGLAMEFYTHFTSPIRRYPDVLVHRLLYEIMSGSDKIIDKPELEARCKNSSLMERRAMEAEREATKYKQIEYLQDKVGMEFDGVITGVIMKGIFVEMNENKCEGLVNVDLLGEEDFIFDEKQVRLTGFRTGKKFQMGDKVRVRVLSADIALRRIDLEFVV